MESLFVIEKDKRSQKIWHAYVKLSLASLVRSMYVCRYVDPSIPPPVGQDQDVSDGL